MIVAACCSLIMLGSAAVTEVRLFGGPDRCEGLLQEQVGTLGFGQACNLNADDADTMVVCRQLGCNPVGAERVDALEYGFSDAVNFFRIFGFDCRGFEANLDSCPSPGRNCAADSAPHAVAVRCGGEGEFVPNTGHSANVIGTQGSVFVFTSGLLALLMIILQ